MTALPVEKTGTRLLSVKGVRPAVSADPAQRSSATSPSMTTLKRAASNPAAKAWMDLMKTPKTKEFIRTYGYAVK